MSTQDFSYTRSFLECLAPGESRFTFQTFHDQLKDQPGQIVHGSIDEVGPYLTEMQKQGHGVFWTVNRTDLQGRELANITAPRAVWLDIDQPGRDISPICAALAPHCVVESSPGKHHLYWRVDDLPLAEAQAMLRALRMQWVGDGGATGINRVLRLPGFYHLKTQTPHLTRIAQWNPALPAYEVAHLVHHMLGGFTPQQLDAQDVDTHLHEGPVEGWRSAISEAELQGRLNGQIAGPQSAAAAFGTGDRWTLHELWAPDMHALEAAGERSEARMALLTRLMYLTGGDSKRVHDLVQDHPLAVKDGRQNLLMRELGVARGTFMKWWEPEFARRQAQREETRQLGEGAGEGVSLHAPIWTREQMKQELFYVARGKGVVLRSTKQCFKLEDATAFFAASKEEVLKEGAEQPTKVSSLSLWLADPERRYCGVMTWRPSEPEVCEPMDVVDGHTTAYNTWRGLRLVAPPENWQDWAKWFTYHVEYMVPVAAERHRFMQWLAHIVQKPGELPHTAYLMVTKTTGTGRNWLTSVLARALQGYTALGVSLGPILDGKFNGVLSQKLLATVDEVREGVEGDRYGRAEALKKLITEEQRQIDHKYGMQVREQNCCRWLILSNHGDDALPFDNTDRRLIVIQNPEHRQSEDYYQTIYGMLAVPAFIASVRQLLATYSLEGFNAGAPAPMNEAKAKMIEGMTNSVDKAIAGFVSTWPERVATLRDLQNHVQAVTGDRVRPGSLRHAMRRQGIEQHQNPVQIDGADEVVIWWGDEDADPVAAVKAARSRKAFVVVK